MTRRARDDGRLRSLGVCVALVIGATAIPPLGGSVEAHASAHERAGGMARVAARAGAIVAMRELAGGTAYVRIRPTTGNVTFVGSAARPLTAPSDDDLESIADRFLDRVAPAFGVEDAADLDATRVVDGIGTDSVRFRQVVNDVPVLGGEIAVQIDHDGAVRSASGETSASAGIETEPTVPASTAGTTAVGITARADHVDAGELAIETSELVVYDPALIGSPSGDERATDDVRLVWKVNVRTDVGDVDRVVLVDARDGTVVLHFSSRADAQDRRVCDNNNTPSSACTTPVRTEGAGPVASAEVNIAYELSGVTYDFYASVLGRDSIDDAGMPLKSTVRFSPNGAAYANAFWNGYEMFYGTGYADADDVVGHELTHGVTQYTSNLLYYAESGAINESLSDVMGELIDLWSTTSGPDPADDRWLLGEQLPIGAIRDMRAPSTYGDPDRMTSPLFYGGLADNRGVHINSGVNNKAAYLMVDGTAGEPGGSFNGQTIRGLGIIATAKIYYEAGTTLLGPGSDHVDLASALPQACTNLIGVSGTGIVADDCAQVTKIVVATEMAVRPTSPGASLTAPLCDAGRQFDATLFVDDMETDDATWSSSAVGGAANWGYVTGSSQSGQRSVHVDDVAGPRGTSSLTLSSDRAISVPTGATTHLRFDHSFETDWDSSELFDGGVVEYSTDDGSTWNDIETLGWTDNGYNDTLSSASFNGAANQLAGRGAFGTISPSYQTSRADLSSLAGETVRLRFRFATDNYPAGAYAGWFVDDVMVYTCAASGPPASTVPASTVPASTVPASTVPASTVPSPTGTMPSAPSAPRPVSYAPVAPARLLDTRTDPDLSTADGAFLGGGMLAAGSTLELRVAGRAGVPIDAGAAALNVTVTGATRAGYLTVFPCGNPRPNASSVNHSAGQTIPNLVISGIGSDGRVCIFTLVAAHVIADVSGFQPASAAYTAITPVRLLETRSEAGLATDDGRDLGAGPIEGGETFELQVAGRAGVPATALAAVLNVTVTGSRADGYVTVYPCGTTRPTASNLNHVAGQTIANLVISGLGPSGSVCIYVSATTDVVVDLTGFHRAASVYAAVRPARLLDTRTGPGITTVDGDFLAGRIRPAGSIVELQVTGRAGVPDDATAAVLNVTVADSTRPGFVTIYPCGSARPTASNVNHEAGQTIPNLVVSGIGVGGRVCIYTSASTHVIADLNGYQPA